MPAKYNNYFESFIGDGALLFALTSDEAIINDVNEALLAIYKCLADKESYELMINDLIKHEKLEN